MERERLDGDGHVHQTARSEPGRGWPITGKRILAIAGAPGRGKHVSPGALVMKNPREIKVRSDQLTSRILFGLLDWKKYTLSSAPLLCEYTQILLHSKGTIRITFSPLREESWEQVIASLSLLGDELVDTFLVLLAVALDSNGAEAITEPFLIGVDDILTICQKKKSNGSYAIHQRQKVIQQLLVLSRASVEASLTLNRGKTWHIKNSLLDILMTSQPYDYLYSHTYGCLGQVRLKIGDWAGAIPEHQFQMVLLPRQILQYHAKEQKHEKRLGRYLTLLYRINAHKNEGFVKVSMGVLLEQSGIVDDRDHPGRMQEAIESALYRLQSDGVIGSFAPCREDSEAGREAQQRIQQHAYHWWDDYRQTIWLFEFPERNTSSARTR